MDPIKKPIQYYFVMFLFYLIPSAFISITFVGGMFFILLMFWDAVLSFWYFMMIFLIIMSAILLALFFTRKLYYANKEIAKWKK